jgi:hypothetical protein
MLNVLTKPALSLLLSALIFALVSAASVQGAPVSAAARTGIAKFYSPGVFREVAAHRKMAMRHDVDGYASVPSCGWIGQLVRARLNGGPVETYHVLDCSSPGDLPAHLRAGLVIEVDYRSAVRNGFAREGHAQAVVYYP